MLRGKGPRDSQAIQNTHKSSWDWLQKLKNSSCTVRLNHTTNRLEFGQPHTHKSIQCCPLVEKAHKNRFWPPKQEKKNETKTKIRRLTNSSQTPFAAGRFAHKPSQVGESVPWMIKLAREREREREREEVKGEGGRRGRQDSSRDWSQSSLPALVRWILRLLVQDVSIVKSIENAVTKSKTSNWQRSSSRGTRGRVSQIQKSLDIWDESLFTYIRLYTYTYMYVHICIYTHACWYKLAQRLSLSHTHTHSLLQSTYIRVVHNQGPTWATHVVTSLQNQGLTCLNLCCAIIEVSFTEFKRIKHQYEQRTSWRACRCGFWFRIAPAPGFPPGRPVHYDSQFLLAPACMRHI